MAVLYTLCAGLLTFDNGPATYVGNHYFSAWAGFFISFAVFGSVLMSFWVWVTRLLLLHLLLRTLEAMMWRWIIYKLFTTFTLRL